MNKFLATLMAAFLKLVGRFVIAVFQSSIISLLDVDQILVSTYQLCCAGYYLQKILRIQNSMVMVGIATGYVLNYFFSESLPALLTSSPQRTKCNKQEHRVSLLKQKVKGRDRNTNISLLRCVLE